MVAGGDGGQGNMGERERVSQAFASSIVLKAHRLVDYIQGQLAHHLSFARKPFLPMWLPDYRAFASARWADRIISRVYDTIQSLPGTRHVGSTASVEPSPFVWFQPNRPWSAMPQEDEHVETKQGPVFGTTAFAADSAGSHKSLAATSDSQGHLVSTSFNESTPQPHRSTKPASLFAKRQRPPTALLHRMGLRLGLAAEPDDAANQAPGLPITYPRLIDTGESIRPAVEDATGRQDHVVSSSFAEPTMTRHDDEPARSILPPLLERALPAGRPSHTLPQVKKVMAFVHRLLAAPAVPLQDQGLTPLAVSTAATDVHPLAAVEETASSAVEPAGQEWTEEHIESVLPGTLSPRDAAPGRSSPTGSGPRFAAWLHGRRYQASRALPSEQAYIATEAYVQAGLPGPLHTGSEVAAASMAPPSPEFVFPPSRPVGPASPADLAVQTLQPLTSHDLVLPRHQPPPQQRAPVSGSLSQTPPTTAMAGLGPGAPPAPAGPSQGAIASPGFALAPLERPGGAAGPSGATQGAGTGEPTSHEGTEETTEANLERLARDVYAVLKRRLAWERERNMVLTS